MKVKESEIKTEWLDKIWAKREFIQNLERVQQDEYDKLIEELKQEGLNSNTEEWLFEFVFNEKEINYFDEWLFERGMLIEDEN